MHFQYRWIKDEGGALDCEFVASLARHFAIDAFLETGTYMGDTLASVRNGFARLLSIELAPEFVSLARHRFAGDHAISIIQANSATGLVEAFACLRDRPAVLWLDAHYSGGPTAKGDGNTPIIEEIEQILSIRDGRDVILVDDARLFWPIPSGFASHETHEDYPLLSHVAERLVRSPHAYRVYALGDALLAAPDGLEASPVLAACTASRLASPGALPDPRVEATLTAADGSERLAIAQLPSSIEGQKAYGLGGHYFYWRGLIREADGSIQAAREDLLFAAQCGVIPMNRANIVRQH